MHTILTGHVLDRLREIPDASVDCIVTSPPYWSLRDYGVEGQIGLEPSFAEFLANLTAVFEECKRVLKKTGTMWVNMGDAYSASGAVGSQTGKQATNRGSHYKPGRRAGEGSNLRPKNLIGQPWRLAFALQDAGWILRSDIIWHKPSAMPSSAKDRPTVAHEYIFLFAKSLRYHYDHEAIAEPAAFAGEKPVAGWDSGPGSHATIDHAKVKSNDRRYSFKREQSKRGKFGIAPLSPTPTHRPDRTDVCYNGQTRNARTVWTIASKGYPEAHFATFPEELPKRCILAGCPEGGTVLDPFAGSGTTLAVAVALGRKAIGIELNPEYVKLIEKRMATVTPSLFLEAAS